MFQKYILFSNAMTKQESGAHLWKAWLLVCVRLDWIIAITLHLLKRNSLKTVAMKQSMKQFKISEYTPKSRLIRIH